METLYNPAVMCLDRQAHGSSLHGLSVRDHKLRHAKPILKQLRQVMILNVLGAGRGARACLLRLPVTALTMTKGWPHVDLAPRPLALLWHLPVHTHVKTLITYDHTTHT